MKSMKRASSTFTSTAPNMTEPSVFIAEYLRARGITGMQDSEISRQVRARAEEAREQFKRLRSAPNDGVDEENMTKEQKYNRRLANNRKSAAASRVYSEVLRRETEHALKETSEKSKTIGKKIEEMTKELQEERALNNALKERIERLETTPRDPPSPTSVSEPRGSSQVPQAPPRLPTIEPPAVSNGVATGGTGITFGLSAASEDIGNLYRFSQENWRASQEFRLSRNSQDMKLSKDIELPSRVSQDNAYDPLLPLSSQDNHHSLPSTQVKFTSQDIAQVGSQTKDASE